MSDQNREALLTIAILAALADDTQGDSERDRIRGLGASLGGGDVESLIQRVTANKPTIAAAVSPLASSSDKKSAYEMALIVCNADGALGEKEQGFLKDLRTAMGLGEQDVRELHGEVASLASASTTAVTGAGKPPEPAGLDDLIVKQAMLTAALELLPHSLATMAIIPLQMRLVYQIGASFGQQLDGSQLKDLLATFGLGAATQAVEGFARKIIGGIAHGVLGGLLGGIAGGVVETATGAAVSFASTYALGHAAKQYYAQGRRLSTADLRSLFLRFQEDAKTMYPKVQQQVRSQAQSLNLNQLLTSIRGG